MKCWLQPEILKCWLQPEIIKYFTEITGISIIFYLDKLTKFPFVNNISIHYLGHLHNNPLRQRFELDFNIDIIFDISNSVAIEFEEKANTGYSIALFQKHQFYLVKQNEIDIIVRMPQTDNIVCPLCIAIK